MSICLSVTISRLNSTSYPNKIWQRVKLYPGVDHSLFFILEKSVRSHGKEVIRNNFERWSVRSVCNYYVTFVMNSLFDAKLREPCHLIPSHLTNNKPKNEPRKSWSLDSAHVFLCCFCRNFFLATWSLRHTCSHSHRIRSLHWSLSYVSWQLSWWRYATWFMIQVGYRSQLILLRKQYK